MIIKQEKCRYAWDFPVVQWLRLNLPTQQVQSLVWGLRYHCGLPAKKKQNVKQMQYCNKFNEDFKKKFHIKNKKKNQKGKKKDNKVMLNTVPGILLSLLSHYNFQVIFDITNENGFPWAVGWEKSLSLWNLNYVSWVSLPYKRLIKVILLKVQFGHLLTGHTDKYDHFSFSSGGCLWH